MENDKKSSMTSLRKSFMFGLVTMIALLLVLNIQIYTLGSNVNSLSNLVSGDATLSGSESSEEATGLAGCLIDSGAKFYGTDWCGYCAQQKELLGDIFTQYSSEFYVACDGDGASACSSAGIQGYPAWIINGEQYMGVQSLDALAAATNCNL